MTRPYVSRVHSYYWMDGNERIDGIALRAGNKVLAHLTPSEAIKLSNRLVDIAEHMEAKL